MPGSRLGQSSTFMATSRHPGQPSCPKAETSPVVAVGAQAGGTLWGGQGLRWAGLGAVPKHLCSTFSKTQSDFCLRLESVLRAVGVFLSTSWRVQQQTYASVAPTYMCVAKVALDSLAGTSMTSRWHPPSPLHSPAAGSQAAWPPSDLFSASLQLHQRDLWSPSVLVTCHCSSNMGANLLIGWELSAPLVPQHFCPLWKPRADTVQQTLLPTLYILGVCQVRGAVTFPQISASWP